MAMPKRVKVGGSYYKGYKLVVSAAPGNYVLNMTLSTAAAYNGITVIPDAYGAGDYFTLEHLDASGNLIATLANTIYNVGASAAWQFDFAALELMTANHILRLTYVNVAGTALNVYTSVEHIR
jgi:hypothetical protein